MNIEKLTSFVDTDGTLVPLELNKLPFEPKRIFYITGVPFRAERGNHAHHTTQQVLICVKGSVQVKLYDGEKLTKVKLKENQSVFIDKMIWDSQVFLTDHDVLLCLASTNYDPKDYITNKREFEVLKEAERKNEHS